MDLSIHDHLGTSLVNAESVSLDGKLVSTGHGVWPRKYVYKKMTIFVLHK